MKLLLTLHCLHTDLLWKQKMKNLNQSNKGTVHAQAESVYFTVMYILGYKAEIIVWMV